MEKRFFDLFRHYLWIFGLILTISLFFQNCAVYKSEGKRNFEILLSQGEARGCGIKNHLYLQLLSVDAVMDIQNRGQTSLAVIDKGSGDVICDFTNILSSRKYDKISCDTGIGNADQTSKQTDLVSCNGDEGCLTSELFSDIPGLSVKWVVEQSSTPRYYLFNGKGFGILSYDQNSNQYGMKYYALSTGATRGASCAITLNNQEPSSSSKIQDLERLTQEMASQLN